MALYSLELKDQTLQDLRIANLSSGELISMLPRFLFKVHRFMRAPLIMERALLRTTGVILQLKTEPYSTSIQVIKQQLPSLYILICRMVPQQFIIPGERLHRYRQVKHGMVNFIGLADKVPNWERLLYIMKMVQ